MAQAEAFIREAAARGADFIQTPENTLLMEINSKQLLEKITPEEATEGLAVFSRLAHELGVWLHIGSIAIKLDDKHAANRAFLFAPDGRLAARYDKIHMFDVNLPSGETYREFKQPLCRVQRRFLCNCRGAGWASPHATTCAFPSNIRLWLRQVRNSSPRRPPLRKSRARPIGTYCFALEL